MAPPPLIRQTCGAFPRASLAYGRTPSRERAHPLVRRAAADGLLRGRLRAVLGTRLHDPHALAALAPSPRRPSGVARSPSGGGAL